MLVRRIEAFPEGRGVKAWNLGPIGVEGPRVIGLRLIAFQINREYVVCSLF